jgi:hypothetical protein
MTVALFLGTWMLLSMVVGILVGRALALRDAAPRPGWSARELEALRRITDGDERS